MKYDDGDAETLLVTLEELLPLVKLNFVDFYAAAGTAQVNNIDNASSSEQEESARNSDDDENSVTNTDETNSESEDTSLPPKYFRRGYLTWHLPRDKYINTKGTENKIMKEACTIGAGSTIPPDVEGFGTSVMARCPKEAVRLLLTNKSVAASMHMQLAEYS